MKICFLVPDGVGVRNYLYSKIIQHLIEEKHEVLIWHNLDPEIIKITKEIHDCDFKELNFPVLPENIFLRFIREFATLQKLTHDSKLFDNPTLLDNWDGKKDIVAKASSFLSKFFPNKLITSKFRRSLDEFVFRNTRNTLSFRTYKSILEKECPDVIFCTHQRIVSVGIAMEAAKSLSIKTATAIFSWDNVPKARLPIRADNYFVWSDYMKNELLSFYPEISKDSVKVTGTPQFSFYHEKDMLVSREIFANKYSLNPEKKWVCFSGDDIRTSPYDEVYLQDLANAFENENHVQILFRQVPVEDTERYQEVIKKSGNIVHIPPIWKKGSTWNLYFPMFEDICLLVNLAFHCDTVVNLGSTMALDFAMFNKPAVYLNYPVGPNGIWSPKRTYNFHHFRSLNGLDAVIWLNSKSEIKEKILLGIHNPDAVAPDRKKWLDKVVAFNKGDEAIRKIVFEIQNIS